MVLYDHIITVGKNNLTGVNGNNSASLILPVINRLSVDCIIYANSMGVPVLQRATANIDAIFYHPVVEEGVAAGQVDVDAYFVVRGCVIVSDCVAIGVVEENATIVVRCIVIFYGITAGLVDVDAIMVVRCGVVGDCVAIGIGEIDAIPVIRGCSVVGDRVVKGTGEVDPMIVI